MTVRSNVIGVNIVPVETIDVGNPPPADCLCMVQFTGGIWRVKFIHKACPLHNKEMTLWQPV